MVIEDIDSLCARAPGQLRTFDVKLLHSENGEDIPKPTATHNQLWAVEWRMATGQNQKQMPCLCLKARISIGLVSTFFIYSKSKSNGLNGKLTHHVNHVLKLFLVDEMVVSSILLTIVGPPCGVTDSADANMVDYRRLGSSSNIFMSMLKYRPIGEEFSHILTKSVRQLSLPTALRTSQNQHRIRRVRGKQSAPRKHTHTWWMDFYYIFPRYVFCNYFVPQDYWQSCESHFSVGCMDAL